LADDAAFALGDVGGAPGGVEVVEGYCAVLHVGAGAELFGGSDEYGDVAGAAGGEEAGEVGVGGGVVDEPDRLGGHALLGELGLEFVVSVPAVAGGAEVAEHELEGAPDRIRGAVRGPVFVVVVLAPDRGDPFDGGCGLARGGLGQAPSSRAESSQEQVRSSSRSM
jgi:hypothetical protein